MRYLLHIIGNIESGHAGTSPKGARVLREQLVRDRAHQGIRNSVSVSELFLTFENHLLHRLSDCSRLRLLICPRFQPIDPISISWKSMATWPIYLDILDQHRIEVSLNLQSDNVSRSLRSRETIRLQSQCQQATDICNPYRSEDVSHKCHSPFRTCNADTICWLAFSVLESETGSNTLSNRRMSVQVRVAFARSVSVA
jgi:hypothetical protein